MANRLFGYSLSSNAVQQAATTTTTAVSSASVDRLKKPLQGKHHQQRYSTIFMNIDQNIHMPSRSTVVAAATTPPPRSSIQASSLPINDNTMNINNVTMEIDDEQMDDSETDDSDYHTPPTSPTDTKNNHLD